jgi:hypothetical protein
MDRIDPKEHRRVDRRTFLKGGIAGGVIAGAGLTIRAVADTSSEPATAPAAKPAGRIARSPAGGRPPNILVIVVDQLRFPQWFGATPIGARLPPNIERLRRDGVSFDRHYTASNDCTPSRAAMLTGLYTHQTGCMITGGSTLDPGFPTWGTMLREHGYSTRWLRQVAPHPSRQPLDPGQGRTGARALRLRRRHLPLARRRPRPGLAGRPADRHAVLGVVPPRGRREPWCTTVSFVNPHDIAWWYVWSDRVPAETGARRAVQRLPPNFETPELLAERAQAAAAALLSGNRRGLVRSGALQRPRIRLQMAAVPGSVRQAPARGRSPCRPRPAHTREPAARGGEHGGRVHLRPRRVRRVTWPAGQGRERVRGGDPRPADRQGPARRADQRPRAAAHAAQLERRRGATAADHRHGVEPVA